MRLANTRVVFPPALRRVFFNTPGDPGEEMLRGDGPEFDLGCVFCNLFSL